MKIFLFQDVENNPIKWSDTIYFSNNTGKIHLKFHRFSNISL